MVDLLSSLADDPVAARADMVARAREFLGPLSTVGGVDRFDERFFPLDARSGIRARWDRQAGRRRDPIDAEQLDGSGLLAFEHALEQFLVEERGRAQLTHLHTTAKRIGAEVHRFAEVDRATAAESVSELKRRVEELEPSFKELQAISKRVARTVDSFVERQQTMVWQDLRDFMAQTEEALPDAVSNFDLGGLAGLDLLTPAGRARVEATLRKQLEGVESSRG